MGRQTTRTLSQMARKAQFQENARVANSISIDLAGYSEIATEWRDVDIRLADLPAEGVDLSHLVALELVFEWEMMSGATYIDDIRFGTRSTPD